MGWLEFITAGLLFLISHRVPALPSVRARLTNMMGERGFVITYAGMSLVLLVWLIVAAGRAPYVALWPFEAWQTWVPIIAMPIAFLLLVFSIGVPNPLSFGGGDETRFDPRHPGSVGFARHGILWAFALWSLGHMIPNGDVAHVVLFGVLALFSLTGMLVIDRRKKRQLGTERWQKLAHATSLWPGQSILTGRWTPQFWPITPNTLTRLVLAMVLFLGTLWLHDYATGVSPLPLRL